MYCGECGFKNNKGDRYCAECGKPLLEEKNTTKKIPKKMKPMSKKTKIGLVIMAIILVLGIIGYSIGDSLTNPKKVALNFFEAKIDYDADTLYSNLKIEDSEFTSKKTFKRMMNRMKKENKQKIINYKVTKVNKSSSGLYANVTINYTVEGDNNDHSENIRLFKTQGKKFLFFDEWKVSNNDLKTVDEFEFTVMKDSEVSLEGVKVDKKYIDQELSSDTKDVYVLPSLLPFEYEAEVTLPYGFTVTDTLNPNAYSGTDTLEIDVESFPEKEIDKIEKQISTDVTTLYNNAIENKSYEEIKNNFSYEGDLNKMQDVYEDLKDDLISSYTNLTNIEYQSFDITDIEITMDGLLSLTVHAKYKYTISYEEDGEIKTTEATDTNDSVSLIYAYQDNTYKMVDASGLPTFFSRYS